MTTIGHIRRSPRLNTPYPAEDLAEVLPAVAARLAAVPRLAGAACAQARIIAKRASVVTGVQVKDNSTAAQGAWRNLKLADGFKV